MTIIVGVTHNDHVYLGADSRASWGDLVRPKRIQGVWPDGRTATATQYHSVLDGEWTDDRLGQSFALSLDAIGDHVPVELVQAHARDTFWDGVTRVTYVVEGVDR